ncbi:FRG domain-containing protein [Marinilabiliaceae bacterium JC017]|nr:FRG domain-containing protein [Marinilabiliaceae bacterium JC017]
MVTEKHVKSFSDFHDIITEHNKNWYNWYYRGESDPNHMLVPKVGRPHFVAKHITDHQLFETWCRHAIAYLTAPTEDKWDLLAIAQHHGLATRLLDWTCNPMIAAFFAVTLPDNSRAETTESAIFAHYSTHPFIDPQTHPDPFTIPEGIFRVSPRSIAPRIMRQGGIFTIHNSPSACLEKNMPQGDRLEKIIINRQYRKQFTIELSHYGVNKLSLFPDLDGLSRHVNWSYLNLQEQDKEAE